MNTVTHEQMRILHRLSPPAFLLSYVVAIIVAVAYEPVLPSGFIVPWLVSMTLITLARSLSVLLYHRKPSILDTPIKWALLYCVGTLVAGINWAIFGAQFDAQWPSVYQVALFTIMTGLIAGAVGSHSSFFPALACFYSPILLTLIYVSSVQTDRAYLLLLPLVIIFWIMVHSGGRRFSKMLRTNIFFQQTLANNNERLELLARMDTLTQLQNRSALELYLNENWAHFYRNKKWVSIAMLDVDFFKAYNDHYGHIEGDRCLTRIAEVLRAMVPEDFGFVGRYGGEEFIVVLPGCSLDAAQTLMAQVQAQLRNEDIEHARSGASSRVTVSVGIHSAVPESESDWVAAIDRADAKLYIAKQRGRAQVVA